MATDKRKRTPVLGAGPGVYEDKFGYGLVVWYHSVQSPELRIKKTGGVTLTAEELRKRREKYFKAFKLEMDGAGATSAGTLAEDVKRYVSMLPPDIAKGPNKRRTRVYFQCCMAPFVTAFSDRETLTLTANDARLTMSKMLENGKAEATVNLSRNALCRLFKVLYPDAKNPTTGVEKYRTDYNDPRGYDMTLLRTIVDSMPDMGAQRKEQGTRGTVNGAKLRMRVMLETGIPPATLMRVRPIDLDLRAKMVRTSPRRKGKGAKGVNLRLADRAVEAFGEFVTHDLFGPYDQQSVNGCFQRAVQRYKKKWTKEHPGERWPLPADIRSYDVRHSFLSELYRRCRSLDAVANAALHSPGSPLTKRYTQAAADEVTGAAIDLMNA